MYTKVHVTLTGVMLKKEEMSVQHRMVHVSTTDARFLCHILLSYMYTYVFVYSVLAQELHVHVHVHCTHFSMFSSVSKNLFGSEGHLNVTGSVFF